VNSVRSAKRTVTRRRSDVTVGLAEIGAVSICVPQFPQKFVPGSLDVPHDGQAMANGLPQFPQNLFPTGFSLLQTLQITFAHVTCIDALDLCRISSCRRPSSGGEVLATKQENLQMLGGVPFLSDLSKRDLDKVLAIAKPTVHTEGAEVMTEGHGGVGFHLITDGKAKVQRAGRTVATLGPGEFFGEMALVDDGPRTASVTADTELTTLVISKWEFRPLVKSHPELAWKLIEHLVVRLREEQTGRDLLVC
jgi:Cyclic nucleotide-binding domain